jgi:octaprenyl-diphosphate synthase
MLNTERDEGEYMVLGISECSDVSELPTATDYKKNQFVSFLSAVEPDVARCEKLLPMLLASTSGSSKEITNYILERPGKRMRIALFYFCAELVDFNREDRDALAAVGEIVHTASLLHDDIIDEASMRRGHASPHTIFGPKKAILVGDMLLASASRVMCQSGSTQVVDGFSRAIHQMSDGELLQLDHLHDPHTSEDQYWKIMEYKTSVLLAAICQTPAILQGLQKDKVEALWNFGLSLGNIFQICDDILDYFQTSEFAGKQTFADFQSGKMTLPLFLLKQAMQGSDETAFTEWQEIESAFTSQCHTEKGIDSIRSAMKRFNIFEKCTKFCEDKNLQSLSLFSSFFPEAVDSPLVKIGALFLARLPKACR